jgi:hypothetical protein
MGCGSYRKSRKARYSYKGKKTARIGKRYYPYLGTGDIDLDKLIIGHSKKWKRLW